MEITKGPQGFWKLWGAAICSFLFTTQMSRPKGTESLADVRRLLQDETGKFDRALGGGGEIEYWGPLCCPLAGVLMFCDWLAWVISTLSHGLLPILCQQQPKGNPRPTTPTISSLATSLSVNPPRGFSYTSPLKANYYFGIRSRSVHSNLNASPCWALLGITTSAIWCPTSTDARQSRRSRQWCSRSSIFA